MTLRPLMILTAAVVLAGAPTRAAADSNAGTDRSVEADPRAGTNPVRTNPIRVGPPTANVTSHTRVLQSQVLNEARTFTVHLPLGHAQQPDRTYPVLIVLDGDAYGGLVAETAGLMRIRGAAPPVITVAVSNVDRERDFLPFAVDDIPTSGGAGPFIGFLRDELLPFVEDEYRGNGYRILFGHSFGGVLAAYALVCYPDLCQAALAASPALYYDRGRTLRTMEKILATRPPAAPRFLFLSMATELTYGEALDFLKDAFAKHGDQWLRWQERRYPDETHGSMVFEAIPDGLQGLFEGWALPRAALAGGWDAVAAHYAGLSGQMGYEVMIPEAVVNQLGYQALTAGNTDSALRLFRRNAETYPSSANVWDSLGEALLAAGDTDAAVASYRRALAQDPGFASARAALARLGADLPAVPE